MSSTNNTIRLIITNTLSQITSKLLIVILSVAFTMFITRRFGPSIYGEYIYYLTIASTFSVISDFGISISFIKNIYKKNENYIFENYLILKLLLTIISFILPLFLFLLNSSFSKNNFVYALIASIVVAIGNYSSIIFTFIQSKNKIYLFNILDILIRFLIVIFSIIGTYIFNSIVVLFIILGFGNILYILIGKIIFREIDIKLNFENINYKIIYKLFLDSIKIGISSILLVLYFKADLYLLSLFSSNIKIGYYGLSYKIFENILMLWGFFMATIYPLLSKYYIDNKILFYKTLKYTKYLSIISGMIISVISYFLSTFIIIFISGNSYKESSDVLKIISIAIPFLFINNVFYHEYVIKNKIFHINLILLSALLINLILNIIFIPIYNIIAASYITIITELYILISYLLINILKSND